ncbi:MAG: immunoglobulin domain-containing protein [Verrucomicrobiota bacterium]
MVDGLNGAAGNLVLNWSLVGAPDAVPRIVVAPRSQVVGSGVEVTIGVLAASLTPLQYQWRFNCSTLLGQTNDTLHIRQVGRQQVGIYSVQVSNAARVIESEPATLQVNLTQGAITEVLACDKLVDATAPSSGLVLRARARNGSSLRPQVVSLSKGVTGLQIFNTYGATKEPGEPNHCGVAGGASYWFALRTESDGLLTVSTEGSDFDTVLAVYTLGGTRVDSLILMACDDNSGLDGLTSLTCFGAKAGTVYHIAVDGVNGTTGTVRLSYALDEPATALPLIPTQTSFRAQFGGAAGRSYRVQASGDLVRWHSLFTTNLTSANLFQFIDPNMLRLTYRFYRALPVP